MNKYCAELNPPWSDPDSLLSAAQMRACEAQAIATGAVSGLELMERAGRGVAQAVFEQWPDLARAPHRAVVLCGPGNNGGDGFVVARLLAQWGWEVSAFLFGEPGRLPPDARRNFERWSEIAEAGRWCDIADGGPPAELVVDALFGTGLTRPVAPELAAPLLAYAARDGVRVVAVDIPSGLDSDSGRCLGHAGRADLTVTFHSAKLGHHLAEGPERSGRLRIHDIGLRPVSGAKVVRLARPTLRDKSAVAHKYDHGHALILSGGPGRTGAARLAARGALRVGAGLVSLGVPDAARLEVACQITAIMLRPAGTPEQLSALLRDTRVNALCLGPGLGVERARDLVGAACDADPPRGLVLDADALTAFAGAPEALFAMVPAGAVLTPHGGEFARLFPDLARRLEEVPRKGPAFSRLDAAREAARRAGCVVLLKGADTVIAAPDGRARVHSAHYERAAPWLATAGAGDVLAGFITGLLARGLTAFEAAETGAWLHAECARRFGPGLIAEDLPEELPCLYRELGL